MSIKGTGCHFFEDLNVWMEASYKRRVEEVDINAFATLTGDTNPIHLDEDYALDTLFKGRIAHGALTASYISTVLGTLLPGPGAIYISQSLNFRGDFFVLGIEPGDFRFDRSQFPGLCVNLKSAFFIEDGEKKHRHREEAEHGQSNSNDNALHQASVIHFLPYSKSLSRSDWDVDSA